MSKIKKIAQSILISSALLISACTTTKPFVFSKEDKPIEYAQNLKVNTENKVRFVVKKDEKEGAKDLDRLIKKAEFEECWAYLPRKKIWVEVGINEFVEPIATIIAHRANYQIGVSNDMDYIQNLARRNNRIIFYHFHPTNRDLAYKLVRNNIAYQLGDKKLKEEYLASIEQNLINSGLMPSDSDLEANIHLSGQSKKENSIGDFSSKVRTLLGTIGYSLTPKGFEFFKGGNYWKNRPYIFNLTERERKIETNIIEKKADPQKEIPKLSDKFIQFKYSK